MAHVYAFLTDFHEENGHPGMSKTISTLKKYCSIKKLDREVKKFNSKYQQCLENKAHSVKKDLTKGYLTPENPFSKVSSDCYGTFEYIGKGEVKSCHLVTFSNIFSRFNIIRYFL